MWNVPTKRQLNSIPGLYQTEHVPVADKIIHMHFFISGCDWYAVEFDGEDAFKHLVEVVRRERTVNGRVLEPLVVHREALGQIFAQAFRGPLPKLNAASGAHPVANGEDDV